MNATARTSRPQLSSILIAAAVIALIVVNIVVMWQRNSGGDSAPSFTLEVLDPKPGQPDEIRLADLKGKVVVLDFWATWCPSCVRNMPELEAFYRTVDPDKVAIFAINGEGKPNAHRTVRSFISARDYTMPILMDNGSVFDAFRVSSIPQTIIIDTQGRIRETHRGFLSREDLAADVERLLSESAP